MRKNLVIEQTFLIIRYGKEIQIIPNWETEEIKYELLNSLEVNVNTAKANKNRNLSSSRE